MIDLIVYLVIILGFSWLIFENIRLKTKFNKSVATLFQVYIDKNISDDVAKKALEEKVYADKAVKESQEAFINFLNQSREWAFKYIEETQTIINKFIIDIEPDILYFDQYGDGLGAKPNYDSMKRISEAFKKLKTVLPEPDKSDTLG
jgi:hypothetical protein